MRPLISEIKSLAAIWRTRGLTQAELPSRARLRIAGFRRMGGRRYAGDAPCIPNMAWHAVSPQPGKDCVMCVAEMPFYVDSIRGPRRSAPTGLSRAISAKVRSWPEAQSGETICIHCLQVSRQDRVEIKKVICVQR
jgi:hypothetical protein